MDIERFFKHPKLIVALCLIITLVLGCFIMKLDLDNSTELFLPKKDASYKRLQDTQDTFGSVSVTGISITSKSGSILTPQNIEVIRNITDRIKEIPDIENIDSLTHIDFVCDQNGTICASNIIPEDNTDIETLKSNLAQWSDMYDRVIINDDYTSTQMQVSIRKITQEEIDSGTVDSERKEILINQIRDILKEETKDKHLSWRIYGDDVITLNARQFMISDLAILIPIVIVVVLISLFFSFKTIDGTLLPLISVVMATIQACGLMSLFGFKFTIVSSVIPVALIAVGSAYGIHVLNHYYVAINEIKGEITESSFRAAVFEALYDVRKPIILAGVTTVIGFISLISSPIEPLHSFSIFTAAGVAISLLLSVFFIPSLILLKNTDSVRKDIEKQKEINNRIASKTGRNANINCLSYKIYKFCCGTKTRLIVFSAVIIAVSIIGLNKLNIETSIVGYFPNDCQMIKDIHYVDDEFAGTNSLYLIVSGKEKGSVSDPKLLKAVDDLEYYLENKYPEIGKTVSFTSLLKRINQVWHVPVQSNVVSDDYSDESFSKEIEDLDFDTSWGDDFAFEDEQGQEDIPDFDWVDPNTLYLEKLNEKVSVFDFLKMLDDACTKAKQNSELTTNNILTILEKELNYNGMAYYEVPSDVSKYPVSSEEELKGIVENYLTLLSGSLDRFLDDEMNPSSMKIQIQLKTHSTKKTAEIIHDAKQYASEYFPQGYTVEATGPAEIEQRMTDMVISSQILSLVVSLVCVFIIIAVAFKSPVAGLTGTVPLALTILINYTLMAILGINLDLVTSIIASVAVGVGIDYTIHFLTSYKEERALSCNLETVTMNTFARSGKGIIANAVAVGFGFLVLCLSKFTVLKFIGLLVAIVMFSSSFLAMTVMPAILNITKPNFIKPNNEKRSKK